MKTKLISLIALICGMTIITNAQIPNAGFENWTSGDPDDWATSNVPAAGLINIVQTTDNHSGSSALRGEVVNFLGLPMGPVIQSGPGGEGFSVSEKYLSLELYYKFTPFGGDLFGVNVALLKGGNPIAQGAVALPATVSTYTHLTVPLNYTTNDVPDLAIIQILIVGPVTGSDYHTGSEMFVDDLVFSLSTGTENITVPGLNEKCYPNPAIDIINFPLNETVPGEVTLTVFDSYGKEVKKITGYPQQSGNNVLKFPVKDLSPGIYFYSIYGPGSHFNGKFTVSGN
jgi:hypothetical protein